MWSNLKLIIKTYLIKLKTKINKPMAITYAYPTVAPELQDLLIGTEMALVGGEDAPRTRTFSIQSIINLAVAEIGSPTLQEVTTSGAATTNTITMTKAVDQSALIINSSASSPVSNLVSLNSIEGNCLKATVGSGLSTAIEGYSVGGAGVYGESSVLYGVCGFSLDAIGVFGASTNGNAIYGASVNSNGGYFTSTLGTALSAQCNNAAGYAAEIYGLGQGLNVTRGGISITGNAHTGTTYQLSLSLNSAAKPSTNTWTIASDSRVKTNISPYTKGLETILAINPITYDYNGKAGFDITNTGNIGIIAQDVLNIIPESINTFQAILNEEDEEKTELYNFDSHALTFILINAIKQLNAEIELLKSK